MLILSRRNFYRNTQNARKLHGGCADRVRSIKERLRLDTAAPPSPPKGQELAVEPVESKIDKGDGGVVPIFRMTKETGRRANIGEGEILKTEINLPPRQPSCPAICSKCPLSSTA